MRSVLTRFGCILVVGVGLAACRDTSGSDTGPDDTGTGNDVVDVTRDVVTTDTVTDSMPPNDVVSDASDVIMGGPLSIQQVANPALAGHPAVGTNGVMIHGPLVALTTRYVSGPSSHGNCTYSIWVGDPAGGDFSGIEVVESESAPTVDGGAACNLTDTGTVIPANVAIGDMVTMITGTYDNFCPTAPATPCPMGSGAQMFIQHHAGVFAVTSPGTGGMQPPPGSAMITEINGTTMNATRDLPLQNTLVTIHNVFQQQVPVSGTGGNFSTMLVSPSMTEVPDAGDEMPVVVSAFNHATCARTALAAAGVGASLGDVTGVLYYDFGKWTLHMTQSSDITGVNAACPSADAGMDSGTDAAVDAATDATGG
jgi:hypothetical protein